MNILMIDLNEKTFESVEKCEKAGRKLIEQKLKKGYLKK